jgi:hypothetical protein
MGCYKCQGPDGTDVTLCPECRTARAKIDISVRKAVTSSEGNVRPYMQVLKDEWQLVVGLVVMLAAVANGVLWFYLGEQGAFISAPWSLTDPEELFTRCRNSFEGMDTSEVDFDQLREGFATEISEYVQREPEAGKSQSQIIRYIIGLRADQACTAARTICTQTPSGNDCQTLAKTYGMFNN